MISLKLTIHILLPIEIDTYILSSFVSVALWYTDYMVTAYLPYKAVQTLLNKCFISYVIPAHLNNS